MLFPNAQKRLETIIALDLVRPLGLLAAPGVSASPNVRYRGNRNRFDGVGVSLGLAT